VSLGRLDEVQGVARQVLEAVPRESLSGPTPCSDWDLATLINHLVHAQDLFVRFATGNAPSGVVEDPVAGDFVAAYAAAAARIREAVSRKGFDEEVLDLPFGAFTGAFLIEFVSLETLTHTWDIAVATSQATDFAAGPSQHLLEVATRMMDATRDTGNENFAARQPPPEGATDVDRLAAYLGRSS